MYEVSFPGLGINSLHINDTAFQLFGRDVKWYGIILTLGMILGVLYAISRAKIEKISTDDVIDYALWMIIAGVIGSRLYYVIFDDTSYIITSYDSVWKNIWESFKGIIAIWNGGLAIYGAIIGGALALVFVSLKKKISIPKFLDVSGASVIIGQIIGRWGNFVNQEAFGTNTTLPWGMFSNGTYSYLYTHQASLAEMGIVVDPTLPVHPTFLYESLWNLVGFIIIHLIYKKKNFDGQIALFYLAWYGFGRGIIEGFRTDSLMIGSFRVSQLLGFGLFIVSATLLLIFNILSKKKAKVALDVDAVCNEVLSPLPTNDTEVKEENVVENTSEETVETIPDTEQNSNINEEDNNGSTN